MGGGIGIPQQQEEQRRPQRGTVVPLPAEEGRQLKQNDHNGGPHHRRGTPRHQTEQGRHRDEHQGGEPPARPQQKGDEPRQKGQVHPGHRHRVGQAGTLEGGGKGISEAVPVPCDQRLHQRGRVPGEAPVDAVLQFPGPQGGPVPERDGLRPLPAQQAVSLCCEKDPLGGVVGDLLPRLAPVGQRTVGHGLHPVPGAQLSRLAVSKQQGGNRRPLRLHPHQHRPAILTLLGPLRHRPGQADRPVIQRLGGPPEQGRIARRPEEPCRQAHGSPPHRQPCFFAPMRESSQ